MKQILLDTNFLLLPFTFKIDIFSEIDKIMSFPYEFIIFEETLVELKKISINKKEKGKNKEAAKLAMKLILQKQKNNELKIVNFKNIKQKTLYKDIISKKNINVDNLILEYIDFIIKKKEDIIVATQDLRLRKELFKKSVKTIYLRNKKYMEMQNVL